MYNDISQVTYFHYPDYVRSPQIKANEMHTSAMNALPCICCLVPEIPIYFDDENHMPTSLTTSFDSWFWIVSVGTIFLWDNDRKQLLKSCDANIFGLATYYLISKHGKTKKINFYFHH